MFEHKYFRFKFLSVFADCLFTQMSYISLIYSAYEINATDKGFPFGYTDEAKTQPMEIN